MRVRNVQIQKVNNGKCNKESGIVVKFRLKRWSPLEKLVQHAHQCVGQKAFVDIRHYCASQEEIISCRLENRHLVVNRSPQRLNPQPVHNGGGFYLKKLKNIQNEIPRHVF